MLRSFSQKFISEFVKKRDSLVLNSDQQKEIIDKSKRVRSCDYVANFVVKNGVAKTSGIVTRANWRFLLTNVCCYWENLSLSDFPKVSLEFPYFVPKTPFRTRAADWGAVPSNLVFGREGLTGAFHHYEEAKNLYYLLDQRFVINLNVKSNTGIYSRGTVLLTGLELDLSEV